MFRSTPLAAALVCAVALLAGCSASTPTPTGSSPGSNIPTRSSSGSSITVDLTFTGDDSATLQGTKGSCSTGGGFGIELAGSDYPGLGASGNFSIIGPPSRPSWKLLIGNDGFLSGLDSGLTVSSDTKTVTIDADAMGQSAGVTHHEHIRGTITCG